MHIKKIQTEQQSTQSSVRPLSFDDFIGQDHIKSLLDKAIISAQKRKSALWHTLLVWPSWFGKTTLAGIIAQSLWSQLHTITGYALSKPSDLVSLLTVLGENDILFIDEIHRLKPTLEEILYIAMEDGAVDMIMPEWGNIRLPLKPFTLIGATTMSASLSEPFKNRFVYNCHLVDYDEKQKQAIIHRYMTQYHLSYDTHLLLPISRKVDTVPRQIHNLCVKIRDYMTAHHHDYLDADVREWCSQWLQVEDGGLTTVHQKYLETMKKHEGAVWLNRLALSLGIHEKTIEQDIEPLLLKLWLIERTARWRILLG